MEGRRCTLQRLNTTALGIGKAFQLHCMLVVVATSAEVAFNPKHGIPNMDMSIQKKLNKK